METYNLMNSEQNQEVNSNQIIQEAGVGKRLKTAREFMRLSEKDAAARLRLNPKMIPIMENEEFDNGLPPTFMRGYLRSYMRILNFSEEETNATVSKIEATLTKSLKQPSLPILNTQPINHSYRYVRWMTYVVAAILAALVCIWWVSHPNDTKTITKALVPVVNTLKGVSNPSTLPPINKPALSTIAPTPQTLPTALNTTTNTPLNTNAVVNPVTPATTPSTSLTNTPTVVAAANPTEATDDENTNNTAAPMPAKPQASHASADDSNVYTDY